LVRDVAQAGTEIRFFAGDHGDGEGQCGGKRSNEQGGCTTGRVR
jgi:hypothetical protein